MEKCENSGEWVQLFSIEQEPGTAAETNFRILCQVSGYMMKIN